MGYWWGLGGGLLGYIFQIVFNVYLKLVPVISTVDDDDEYDDDDDGYDDDNDDDDNLQRSHDIDTTVSLSGE